MEENRKPSPNSHHKEFNTLQKNGQRIYGGPPDGWQGPAPSRGCEIYVTRIPRDCFEAELLPIFAKIGPIYEHRLMMEHTGVNRGYGYVRYTRGDDAKEAIRRLHNFEVRPGRYLVVTKSVDNRRLWVNGIPKNRSGKEIRGEMERLTSGVNDIILYPSQADKTKSRGYMFVEYESHRAAALARKKLTQGNVFIFGQEVGQVDWAEPEHEVDEETMSTVKILFVRNLMLSTTENTIRDLFNKLGGNCVERVKKTKDYCFVHFSQREAAERALSASGNLKIDDALVEVVWSKPVDKQTYNTRKTLTKAFSSGLTGSDFVRTKDGGYVRGISPRRRGAAGIRGLGAPGTAPPKQLIQRYAALTAEHGAGGAAGVPVRAGLQGILPNHHIQALRPPQDVLQDICVANSWGEPVYSLVTGSSGSLGSPGGAGAGVGAGAGGGEQEAGEGGSPSPPQEKLYTYKVTLPNFPLPHPNNVFQSPNWKVSPDEAKCEAAQLVLTCLRVYPECVAAVFRGPLPHQMPHPHPQAHYEPPLSPLGPHHSQPSPVYPFNPAAFQGIPLTAWPYQAYPGPVSMYNRLAYPDSYNMAYTSMLQGIYGLSISC